MCSVYFFFNLGFFYSVVGLLCIVGRVEKILTIWKPECDVLCNKTMADKFGFQIRQSKFVRYARVRFEKYVLYVCTVHTSVYEWQ